MLTVRESTPDDESEAAVVDHLSTADLRRIYRPTAAAHERRFSISANLQRVVALLDGHVIGTVQYRIDGDRLHLLGLGVHPDFRRRGVATVLVQRLEEVAAESGCHAVVLHTVLETGNVVIFERMGFVIESRQPTDLFESDAFPILSEVVMRKDLPR